MNWDAIGAAAEVLGALAVIFTLLYLTVQVRDSKRATADSNRIERAVGVREGMLAAAQNDDLRNSFDNAAGLSEFYESMALELGVSIEDAARSHYFSIYWFWVHWGQFSSTTEERDLTDLENLVRRLYRTPPYDYCWKHSPWAAPILDQEFVQFVDDLLDGASR